MEYNKEVRVGSKADMLANAEKVNEKVLTLKSLEKRVNEFIKYIEEQTKTLEKKIETVKKSLKK